MDKSKKMFSAAVCLALSLAIIAATGVNFLKARELPVPKEGPSVTEVKMLSDWSPGLKGTNGDTPVYVLKGEKEGGKILVLGGRDKAYTRSAELNMLAVPWEEVGHPIEERCGRHLQGIYEYSQAYNEAHPDAPVVYRNVPGYQELYLDGTREELNGSRVGAYLK